MARELKGLTIAVLGGDGREVEILRQAIAAGARVRSHGCLPEAAEAMGCPQAGSPDEAVKGADVLVCPVPALSEEGHVYAPSAPAPFGLTRELLKALRPGALLIMGIASPALRDLCKELGVALREYEDDSELMILRSPAIAEGAIKLAIEHTEITIHRSRTMILGFGRVAMTLGHLLYGMRAHVHVAARNPVQLARALEMGLAAVPLDRLPDEIGKMDIVFNTIPARILEAPLLERVRPDALILDLAIPPGGVDFDAARRLGRRTIWGRGLGGSAPKTVGQSQWSGILRIIRQEPLDRDVPSA